MRDGVFHADPHPGNMMLLSGGRIGLLDFGSVGRIDPTVRSALQHLLLAVDRGDPAGMCDALLELLGPRLEESDEADLDTLRLERELGRFLARHLGPAAQPDVEMFTALFRMMTGFGLTVPPEVAAVFRALATVEGTLSHLSPGFDILAEARTVATALVTERLGAGPAGRMAARAGRSWAGWAGEEEGSATGSPDGGGGGGGGGDSASFTGGGALGRAVAQELLPLIPMARRIPRRLDRISSAVEQGRLSVQVRLLADERDRKVLSGMVHQLLVVLLGAATGLMGVMLLVFGTGRGPKITEDLELFGLLGYNVLAVSAVLMLRALYLAMSRRA
jgi:ubiquinone biosynthesis protein